MHVAPVFENAQIIHPDAQHTLNISTGLFDDRGVNLISEPAIQGVRRRIAALPDFRAGWEAFEAKMAGFDRARLDELAAVRDSFSKRGAYSFTRMNFLRRAARDAARLAFHYRVSGNQQSARSSRELLGWFLSVGEWRAQGARNGWASDLWTADFAAACGTGLDLLGDFLEKESRAGLAGVILENGVGPVFREWLEPATRIHALDSMGHNWWGVCVAGATAGLLAVRDYDPGAGRRLSLAADGLLEFFNYPGNVLQNKKRTFGVQGDFIESAGYLDFTLEPLVVVFEGFRAGCGRDLPSALPVLREIANYALALVQPLRSGIRRINFGDMGAGEESVGSYAHDPTPGWLWLAREYGRADLFRLASRVRPLPGDILPFLLWPDHPPSGEFEDPQKDRIFANIGVAILRDGMSDSSTLLAIKTGETWNHNQADAGTFVLSSNGQEFFVDPGTTEYSNPLHPSYFKRGFAHNIILHDGRDQLPDLDDIGTKFSGTIAGSLIAPGYKYVVADATGPWEGIYRRFYRHFVWCNGLLVVVDDLMAGYVADWAMLFHHAGDATLRSDGFEIRNGGETLQTHLVWPRPSRVEFVQGHWSRQVPNPYKYEYEITARPYIRACYPGRSPREKFVTIHELPGHPRRKVVPIEAPGLLGVRLIGEADSMEILCNLGADGSVMHHNPVIDFEGTRSDAFLTVRTSDSDGGRLAVHNGSRLHRHGRMVISSLLKGDFLLERSGERTRLHASLSAPANVHVGGDRISLHVPSGDSTMDVPDFPPSIQ